VRYQPSFRAILSIAICASLATACASSTAPPPRQTARIPETLLATPAVLPRVERTVDPTTGEATISGAQALGSLATIYDVAGDIRGQLVALIEAVKTQNADPAPGKKSRPKAK
jgi:hypothetical protein